MLCKSLSFIRSLTYFCFSFSLPWETDQENTATTYVRGCSAQVKRPVIEACTFKGLESDKIGVHLLWLKRPLHLLLNQLLLESFFRAQKMSLATSITSFLSTFLLFIFQHPHVWSQHLCWENQSTINAWVYFWFLYSVLLVYVCMYVFMQYNAVLL